MVKGSPSPGGTPSSDLHEVFLSPTLLLHLCTPILLFLCMGGKTQKLGFLCSLEPITYYVAQAALDLVVLLPLSLPNDEACGPCPAFFGPQILKLDTLLGKSKIPILRLLTS